MPQPSEHIMGMIDAIRRSWMRRELSMLATAMLVGLLAWLGTMVLLDNEIMLSAGGLLGGWAVLATLMVGGLSLAAYRLTIGRPAARELARRFESRVADQENRLVNSIDFIDTQTIEQNAMARAAVVENAMQLDATLAPCAINWARVRLMLAIAGGCVVLLLGYTAFRASYVANAVQRLLDPINPAPHILFTKIEVRPGDAHLVEGDSLTVQATMGRHLVDEAFIEYRMDSGTWTQAAMSGVSRTTFCYDGLKDLWQNVQYRVVAGRSTSPVYTLTVQPRPGVRSVQLFVTPPSYTGMPMETLPKDQGDVAALRGSKVQINVLGSAALSSAQLQISDGESVPLVTADENACGSFTMKADGWYAINIFDASKLSNLSPPRYALTVQEDQPPSAVFREPGRDLIMPVDGTVDLKLDAEDDWGLAWVAIQVKTGNGDWKRIVDWQLPAPGERHKSLAARLKLADYSLNPGDMVQYRALAADYCQPTPNTFVGRSWSISIGNSKGDQSLLTSEAKKALETLQAILALQREARGDVDMDRDAGPIREKQTRVRDLTLGAIDQQRQSIRPANNIISDLLQLAQGPMVQAIQLLADFGGDFEARQPKKSPILKVQDDIIAKLEALVDGLRKSTALADAAQQALEKLSPQQKEQAIKQIRDLVEKLSNFVPAQDKLIDDTKELQRMAPDYTKDDLQKIDQLKDAEDQWAKVFSGSVSEINKLLQQGFADATMADDFEQMVEQIANAAKDLSAPIKPTVVPREQISLELAKELKQDMAMWLPSTPDDTKSVLEEPLSMPNVPMAQLPDHLQDMVGDLLAEENAMTKQEEDQTTSWADSMSTAAGQVTDGAISNFSAKGKTGNQLPKNNELSGRSGDGRSGKSDGQMVSNVARGLDGRQTPTRVTNDPYEQGVVKELKQTPAGGSTGGGKARGAGQEGLQGSSPPPNFANLPFMKDWQQRIRQKAERLAGQLNSVHLHVRELDQSIELMKQAEAAAREGRYTDMFKVQQMVLEQLQATEDLAANDAAAHVDRAFNLPPDRRPSVLDAGDEPVPSEYYGAVRRYFEQLSQEQ